MVTSLNTSTQEGVADPVAFPFSPPSQADLSTYWLPLEPLAQQWASFGHEAMTCPAFGAVGMAFTALSWEAAALRHTLRASQPAPQGQQPSSEGVPGIQSATVSAATLPANPDAIQITIVYQEDEDLPPLWAADTGRMTCCCARRSRSR